MMEPRKGLGINEKRNLMRPKGKRFRRVRNRKVGKWAAEIKEPNSHNRIWLGTYTNRDAAVRAYDTARFHLYGSSIRLNLPEQMCEDGNGSRSFGNMFAIQEKAMEVRARVDAELRDQTCSLEKLDLNKLPENNDL